MYKIMEIFFILKVKKLKPACYGDISLKLKSFVWASSNRGGKLLALHECGLPRFNPWTHMVF